MMINISKDIHSLTDFKRRSADFLQQLKKSRRPMVLTVNGKAEVVVQDVESYQKLLELVDRLEAMEGIQRGLEKMATGQGRSAGEFFAELKEEYPRSAEK